ncbi:LamG domain-containing protein, partial [bacterium]|nr:LamG domain-containing protein [bacterium]
LLAGAANAFGSGTISVNSVTTTGGTPTTTAGTLDLNGFSIGNALSLAGNGVDGSGALFNSSSTAATASGHITLTADATIKASGGDLTVGGNLSGSSYALNIGAAANKTLTFLGNVDIGGLLTNAGAYNLTFTGTNNIVRSSTTFANTGITALGDSADDTFTVLGNLAATDPAVLLAGTIKSAGAMSLGNVTLTANTTLDSTGNPNAGASGPGAGGQITVSGNVLAALEGLSLNLNSGSGSILVSGNVAGKQGGSVSFDGQNDYIDIANTVFPTGNSSYSLEAWIRPVSAGTSGIIGWGQWGSGSQVNALRLGGANKVINYWWSNDLEAPTSSLTNGQWHLVTATYDQASGNNRIFVDGNLLAQRTGSMNVKPATNARIGSTNNGEYFSGLIDEVSVWNRALSSTEITAHLSGAPSANASGLVAYYGFNEG